MRVNGLTLIYKDGINTVLSNNSASYPVGDLLCRIFQGETLYNISRIVRNCVSMYPMRDNLLSQDEIEQAEDYILQSLMYDDFYPARRLSQGSFIRCIEEYRSLDSASQSRLIQEEKLRAEMGGQLFEDIGFGTIGEFLRLCFNNYYVDLINGIILLRQHPLCGLERHQKKKGRCTTNFARLCTTRVQYREPLWRQYMMSPRGRSGIDTSSAVSSAWQYLSFRIWLNRLQNRPLPEPYVQEVFYSKANLGKYCGNPAPQCPGRVCSDYYPQLLHREKVRADELDHLIKNAKGRLYNAKRRHPEQAEVIDEQLSDLTIYSPAKNRRCWIVQ